MKSTWLVLILSLEYRRFFADMHLLHKLVSGSTDCPQLLGSLLFNTKSRTRKCPTFFVNFHATNYGYFSPLSRLPREYNQCAVDIFATSLAVFKNKLDLPVFN